MAVQAARGIEGRLGYRIRVPDSWFELDCEPATRQQSIRRLVEDRVRGVDELWAQRGAIIKLLLEQATAAHESGATYCAGFAMPSEDGAITGSITVSLVLDDQRLAGDRSPDLAATFAPVPRTSDPAAPFAVTSMVDIDGAGSCPRSSGIEDVQLGDGHFLRHVFMVSAVPVPDLDRIFLVALSSPVTALADPLLDLFDAVSGTFSVHRLAETENDAEQPS